jgi:hypothetical protein
LILMASQRRNSTSIVGDFFARSTILT